MSEYIAIKNQKVILDGYSIVPIRHEDRYLIMEWRNEQIYHLRQEKILNKEDQDSYFDYTIRETFNQDTPSQILFSYLNGDECIGYGGLVHINWKDKNAELSFIMNTSFENKLFEYHWNNFLNIIELVAFKELNFHKIYTYAYDLRPKLYKVLEKNNYILEAKLKDHIFFKKKYIDVLIHSKINGTTSY
jgi:RimJ/RimL family protein N-acetyltransferase